MCERLGARGEAALSPAPEAREPRGPSVSRRSRPPAVPGEGSVRVRGPRDTPRARGGSRLDARLSSY